MATVIPEFISVLRKVRDFFYPQIQTLYNGIVGMEQNIENIQDDIAVRQADVTYKHNSLQTISIQNPTVSVLNKENGSAGDAKVTYDSLSNKFAFEIPIGEKGDSMKINHTVENIVNLYTLTASEGEIAFVNANSSQYVKLDTGTNVGASDWSDAIAISPSTAFVQLSDVPSSYNGQANKLTAVSSGATSLVFKTKEELGIADATNLGIHTAILKTVPDDADEFGFLNSNNGVWTLVKISFSNLKTNLINSFGNLINIVEVKSTLADADILGIGDSQNSFETKKISVTTLAKEVGNRFNNVLNSFAEKTVLANTDTFMITDSEDTGKSKKVSISSFMTKAGTLFATLASPTFTGTPSLPTGTIAVTQTSDDSSTKLATTEFVKSQSEVITLPATSGGSIIFDNIPSWVKEIELVLDNVITSGTDIPIVQLGTENIIITNYVGVVSTISGISGLNGSYVATSTVYSGFKLDTANSNGTARTGIAKLIKAENNKWIISGNCGSASGTARNSTFNGSIQIPENDNLQKVVLTTTGTNSFVSGNVSLLYRA